MSVADHKLTKAVPKGAWDTHPHIFELNKYPLSGERHFTPATATLDQLEAFEKSLGIDNTCVAHGLSFRTDCTSLLACLKYFGGRARRICVLDVEGFSDVTLDTYYMAGVRSVCIDFFRTKAVDDVDEQINLIEKTTRRLEACGQHVWRVQIQQPHLEFWHKFRPVAESLAMPLVIDHMTLVQAPSINSTSVGNDFSFTALERFDQLVAALRQGIRA